VEKNDGEGAGKKKKKGRQKDSHRIEKINKPHKAIIWGVNGDLSRERFGGAKYKNLRKNGVGRESEEIFQKHRLQSGNFGF